MLRYSINGSPGRIFLTNFWSVPQPGMYLAGSAKAWLRGADPPIIDNGMLNGYSAIRDQQSSQTIPHSEAGRISEDPYSVKTT